MTPASPEMKQESEVTPTSVDEKNNEGAELYKPTAIIYSYIVISLLTPPPKKKPYHCPYCDLGYSSKANLQLHLTNKRYFKCYVKHKEGELSRNVGANEEGKEEDTKQPHIKKSKKLKVSASIFDAFKMKTTN